jgi:hypothetical protein
MTREPPPEWFGHERIDLGVDAQLELLEELEARECQELFAALRSDPMLSPGGGGRPRRSDRPEPPGGRTPVRSHGAEALISNDYFPSPDAEL